MAGAAVNRGLGRRSIAAFAAVVTLGALAATTAPGAGSASARATTAYVDPALHSAVGTAKVIVQTTTAAAAAAAEKAVSWAGGQVTRQLPIIGGFSARVPATQIDRIARVPGVRAVSVDAKMHVQAAGGSTADLPSVYRKVTRADDLGSAGYNGQGVTVALIDTGVSPSPDLAGRVVTVTTDPLGLTTDSCENLSGSATCADEYGHGTFVAGLIAGNGASSGGEYVGAAPQARILSVKIAGADGSADVSNVLAAIQWVVSFKDTYGIRVLNLSLGTDSAQSYHYSPLDYAVERAWQSGITVVVAASNRGPNPGTISKPADDPYVLTVGAIDDKGTSGLGDDVLPDFSSRGPTAADGFAKPDVVAPGAHVVSLDAAGSAVSTNFPSNMPAPYRRGSGTSFATGIVSGLIADMLSANPAMSPDRVKFALMSTARPDASSDPMAVGAGIVDGYAAALSAPAGLANQGLTPGNGLGSIDADRGSVDVSVAGSSGSLTLLNGTLLTAQLTLFDPLAYTTDPWTGNSWYGNSWYGNSWYGNSWYGNSWYGNSWYGNSWYGVPDGNSWYGNSWYGGSWYGAWDQ
jgi:serine protease AprX